MVYPEPIMKRAGDPTRAVDRLSALPDGLLHAIMSFLPAPQAVRTSLLSRRWRHLWQSAPRIEINEEDFGISMGINRGTLEESWARFEDFATNLLLFHDNTSSLGEFCLRSCVHNWRHVDRWIRRGIKYCPSVLQIQIMGYELAFKLPPMDSSFRRLKMLCLRNVHLDSHFTRFLCSSCPVLEDLDLKNCKFCGNYPPAITSPTLNRLAVDRCFNGTSHPLVIMAPSLTSLSLLDSFDANILLFKMNSLVEAKLYMSDETELFSQKTQHELLGSLFNVTRLELIAFEAEIMLIEKLGKFPIFRNMQTLVLRFCFLYEGELNDRLEALGSFLQNAPCLEKLTLAYSMFSSTSDSEWWETKNISLWCQDRKTFQCHKLKLIKVIYDHDLDHRLIELVWRLGRSLPDVNIELTKEDETSNLCSPFLFAASSETF
ncbi:unnamed protein product [Urochloa decumbens]|uniref:F-box domain-containing protein n=1 Tax=Urochloa decumbens TaxID=240449 RepID=A0ABC9FPZ0_9POAL